LLAAWLAIGTVTRLLAAQTPTHSRTALIEYRWVDAVGQAGSRRYADPNTGQSYVLNDTIVLDLDGFQRAEAHPDRLANDGTWDVIARLNPAGVAAFSSATASHVGQTIVVLLDERIVSSAVIQSPLRSFAGIIRNLRKRERIQWPRGSIRPRRLLVERRDQSSTPTLQLTATRPSDLPTDPSISVRRATTEDAAAIAVVYVVRGEQRTLASSAKRTSMRSPSPNALRLGIDDSPAPSHPRPTSSLRRRLTTAWLVSSTGSFHYNSFDRPMVPT